MSTQIEIGNNERYIPSLIGLLKREDIIKGKLDIQSDFHDRLRMQKWTYIAQRFNLPTDYKFYLYMHGPYSRQLARDYYANDLNKFNANNDLLIDTKRYIELIRDRDVRWLELASTILFYHNNGHTIEETYKRKRFYSRGLIKKVYKDVKQSGLVP